MISVVWIEVGMSLQGQLLIAQFVILRSSIFTCAAMRVLRFVVYLSLFEVMLLFYVSEGRLVSCIMWFVTNRDFTEKLYVVFVPKAGDFDVSSCFCMCTGNQSTSALPRAVGRKQIHCRWLADFDKQSLLHVCASFQHCGSLIPLMMLWNCPCYLFHWPFVQYIFVGYSQSKDS
jgi:hypothetical protein